jgi:hypothetical protein
MPLEFDGVNGIIKNTTSDGDITIKGNDGGSEISALTFDMSAEGAATFNSTVTSTASTTITVADNSDNLTLVSTDADSNSGPNLRLYRNNDSNADGDVLGQIDFEGRNDSSQDVVYARIRAVAEDITDGTEDARLIIEKAVNGSTTEIMRSIGSETVFNDGSIDLDFRVEGNGDANLLFVDAGNDRIGVGTDSPAKLLSLKKDGGGGAIGIDIHNQGTDAADDALITFETQGHRNYSMGIDRSASSFVVMSEADGLGTARLTIDDSGDAIFSGTVGVPALDIMSGSSIHGTITTSSSSLTLNARNTGIMIFQSGGTERMRIGSDGATTITTTGNEDTLSLISTDADASDGPILRMYRNSGSPADGDLTGIMKFVGRNDNSQDVNYGSLRAFIRDASDGSEDGTIQINHIVAGTDRNALELDNDEYVFNNAGIDIDFRVESDGNTHALFVDAGNNRVGINNSSPSQALDVTGNLVISGISRFGNGSAASPAYQFGDDTNTGMFRASSDILGFSTAGSEALRIAADGDVGVGTVDPTQNLELVVSKTASIPTDASVGSTNNGAACGMGIHNENNSAVYSGLNFETRTTHASRWLIGNEWQASYKGDLFFRARDGASSSSEILRLKSDGTVGINTADPSASWVGANNLVVSDTSSDGGITIISGTSGNGNIMFSDAQAGAFSDARGLITYLHNGDSMRFITANAEAMRIDSSQRIGIGTSSSSTKLTIDEGGEPPAEGMLLLQANSSSRQLRIQPPTDADNGFIDYRGGNLVFLDDGTEVFRFQGSSEVVVNDASNDTDFRVESNDNTHMLFVDAGNNRVGIGTTPDLGVGLHIRTADSGGSVNGVCDELVIENSSRSGMTILSGNSSIGTIAFGDDGSSTIGSINYDHSVDDLTFFVAATEMLRIDSDNNNLATGGETAGDVGAFGLCLNQGTADGKILTFKSSDVAHGMTDVAETDTYAVFKKRTSDGGLQINALHDSGDQGMRLEAMCVTENTTKGTTGNGPMHLASSKKNSAGLQQFGSNANLFVVSNNGSTKFIVDAEGELHSDGGAQSAYDIYEDAQLVRAYDLSHGKGVIDSKFDDYIKYNHESLAEAGLVGREKDGTPNNFINVTGMQRLHNGAIWQQYEKHQKLASAFYKLAEKTIGKEEADKLLTEEEIQLLN